MKTFTPLRFSLTLFSLWLLSAVAWSTAWGQSTTKPTLSPSPAELCLPASLTVTFDYSGGTPNTSTTVVVQLRDNSGTPNTTVLEQNAVFMTDGSGNATGVQAVLNLTTATTGIVGNNRRIRIRNAANTSTLSTANSDEIKIKATPTLSGTSQASAVCSGTDATINLTGLLPNVTHSVRYKIGSGSNVNVTGVLSDGSGNASFTVPVTSADNGKTLTINRLRSPAGFDCDLQPSGGNTVALQVNPLPTATLEFANGASGTVCSTDELPWIVTTLTGTPTWLVTASSPSNSSNTYYNEVAVSTFQASGAGPYQITAISDANGCVGVASNILTVTVNPAATASTPELGDSEICQGGIVIVGAYFGGSASSGSFDDGGACGTFSTPTTIGSRVLTTYTPDPNFTGPVTITFTTNDPDGDGGCPAASSSVILTVNAVATAGTPTLGASEICQGGNVSVNADFGGSATSGSFDDGGAGGSFSNASTNGSTVSATYTPAASFTGPVTITFTTNDPDGPCPTATSSVILTVNAVATAGTPTLGASEICQGGTTVSADFGGSATSGSFSDGGAGGSFSNVSTNGSTVSATYTPAASFTGPVTITFTTNNPDGPCPAASSSVILTVNAVGTVVAPTTPNRACQGGSLAVTFAVTGTCTAPSAYTVQLSSATGSFANPTVLGQAAPGTTNLPLAQSLPAGVGYRVRIVSGGQPSAASLPFKIEGPSLSLTPGVGGVPVCRGSAVTLSFNLPANSCAFFEGNVFTAQLSSSTGSFASPTNLGTVVAGQSNSLTIPANVAAGTGYRIRVVSSSPVLASLGTLPFRVNACPGRMSAETAELVVSPNPVVGSEIRVRVSGMDNPTFGLTSGSGRTVSTTVKTDGSGEWVMTPKQALTPGVYVLQATEGTARLTRRVLVTE